MVPLRKKNTLSYHFKILLLNKFVICLFVFPVVFAQTFLFVVCALWDATVNKWSFLFFLGCLSRSVSLLLYQYNAGPCQPSSQPRNRRDWLPPLFLGWCGEKKRKEGLFLLLLPQQPQSCFGWPTQWNTRKTERKVRRKTKDFPS